MDSNPEDASRLSYFGWIDAPTRLSTVLAQTIHSALSEKKFHCPMILSQVDVEYSN